MNRIEERYAREVLEVRLLAREILWYRFEPWKLVLGKRMMYTPDFVVVEADGAIVCHEIKAVWVTRKNGLESTRVGFVEDARVKIKTAAQLFPFMTFVVAAYRKGSGWVYETIDPRADEIPKGEAPPGVVSPDGAS